jgi:hypothetical protein
MGAKLAADFTDFHRLAEIFVGWKLTVTKSHVSQHFQIKKGSLHENLFNLCKSVKSAAKIRSFISSPAM